MTLAPLQFPSNEKYFSVINAQPLNQNINFLILNLCKSSITA